LTHEIDKLKILIYPIIQSGPDEIKPSYQLPDKPQTLTVKQLLSRFLLLQNMLSGFCWRFFTGKKKKDG